MFFSYFFKERKMIKESNYFPLFIRGVYIFKKKSWVIISKSNPLLKIISGSLIYLPSPINISNLWNMGRLLGLILVMQILTGVTLASHYSPRMCMAFDSIDHIQRDVNWGWLLRFFHLNGASFFFFCLFALFNFSNKRVKYYTVGAILLTR